LTLCINPSCSIPYFPLHSPFLIMVKNVKNVLVPLSLPSILSRGWGLFTVFVLIGVLATTYILDVGVINGSSSLRSPFIAADLSAVQYPASEHYGSPTAPAFLRSLFVPTVEVVNSIANNNRLCAHLVISLNLTNFTIPFTKGALEWMVSAAFASLKNQTSARTVWPNSWQAVLVVADNTANDTLIAEHQRLVNRTISEPIRKLQKDGIHIYTTKNSKKDRSLEQLVEDNPQCAWVAKIRLDADDFLAPGYFEYIANSVVVNKLEVTTTSAGESWLGALIASRRLNKLVLGKGICDSNIEKSSIFSGYSVGQTIVVSVSVYAELGYKIIGGDHTALGQLLRNEVAHKVLHDADYSSRAGRLPALNATTNQMEDGFASYNEEYDQLDATRSRVLILDIYESFGQVHPYLITPLSGHFPWSELSKLPHCTVSQIEKIKAGFGYNIDFAFAGMETLEPVELIDACSSNSFFFSTAAKLFSYARETCSQMVERRRKSTYVTM
jgi:hypothetical protein